MSQNYTRYGIYLVPFSSTYSRGQTKFDQKADIPGSGRESVKVVRRRGCVLLGIIRTFVDVIGYQVRRVVSGSLRATKNPARQQVERSGHPIHPLCYRATLYTRLVRPWMPTLRTERAFSSLIGFRRAYVSIPSTQGTTNRVMDRIGSVPSSGGDQFFRSTLLGHWIMFLFRWRLEIISRTRTGSEVNWISHNRVTAS